MPRMILTWLLLSILIGAGIWAWQSLSGKEQWALTKNIAYATMCSLMAIVLLSLLVIVF